MRLRNLELKDAPLMLEWMHDESVVGKLKGNFIMQYFFMFVINCWCKITVVILFLQIFYVKKYEVDKKTNKYMFSILYWPF